MNAEKWLALIFRLSGGLLVLATFAIFLPESWMASTHAALGLGELPRAPIVEYLSRSVSALYAFLGGVFLLVASDVRRYLPLIFYLAIAHVAFGVVLTAIDLEAGLPAPWTWIEGPGAVVVGLVKWLLAHRVRQAAPSPSEQPVGAMG